MPPKSKRRVRRKRKPLATKAYVKRAILARADDKYHYLTLNSSVSYTGTVTDLSSIAPGTTDQTRIGDDLWLKNIILRFQVYNTDVTNQMRIIVFQTKDRFTSTPAVSDILNPTIVTAPSILAPLSDYFNDGKSRFKVLYDRNFACNSQGQPNLVRTVYIGKHKLARKKIEFFAGSSADKIGGIYVLAISNSSAVSHPGFDLVSHIDFTG